MSKWISVEEGVPEEGKLISYGELGILKTSERVLVYCPFNLTKIEIGVCIGGRFFYPKNITCELDALAWMPLPPAPSKHPEVGEKEI